MDFFITQNSLGSEPCKEEFAYALDRALNSRGGEFPLIGLCPTNIEKTLIPAGVRTRLYVSMRDYDWKERILSTIENRPPSIHRPIIDEFTIEYHQYVPSGLTELWNVIEVRPRAGVWSPSYIGIPISEKEFVKPWSKYGPRGIYNQGSSKTYPNDNESTDGQWWLMTANNEVTTSTSLYLVCKSNRWPTKIAFGCMGNGPQYQVELHVK